MKRMTILVALLIVVTGAFVMQNPDLSGYIDATSAIAKPIHANTVDSGQRVSRAGYAGAMMLLNVGQADNGSSPFNNVVVLLDSIPGTAAWQPRDSVTVDSVDNKTYKLTYRGTRQWVRILLRASVGAADTFAINGVFLLSGKRARP